MATTRGGWFADNANDSEKANYERITREPPHVHAREPGPGRLLADVVRFLRRFVAFTSDAQAHAVALWVFHAHAIAAADTTARLAIQSAEKQSGKTRLLEVCELVVPAPLPVANISPAALFRVIGEGPITVLFDEVDAVFNNPNGANEDLRALLNAGYRRGATVARVVGDGKKMRVHRFPVFAPVALAGIGSLPDTVQDRSVAIRLRRRARGEEVEKLRRRKVLPDADQLRARIEEWVAEHLDVLKAAVPEVPDALADRQADIWEPMFAIADAMGGTWPDRARKAAVALSVTESDLMSLNVRLLADIFKVFHPRGEDGGELEPLEHLASVELVGQLRSDDETPWDERLHAKSLARRLRGFGVKPKPIREGPTVFKGYARADFADTWDRYLPTPQNDGYMVTSVTTEASPEAGCNGVTDVTDFSGGVTEGDADDEDEIF